MAKKGDIKDRIGEVYTTNQGHDIEIIEYSGCKNVTVKFKDGVILHNLRYDCITGGRVAKPINKTGEKHITNEGYEVEIIKYTSSKDVSIRFEDGTVLCGVNYQWLVKGSVAKPFKRIGEKHITKQGYEIEIVEYYNHSNINVKFQDGTILENKAYDDIKKGLIKNPYHKTVYNNGYRGAR